MNFRQPVLSGQPALATDAASSIGTSVGWCAERETERALHLASGLSSSDMFLGGGALGLHYSKRRQA